MRNTCSNHLHLFKFKEFSDSTMHLSPVLRKSNSPTRFYHYFADTVFKHQAFFLSPKLMYLSHNAGCYCHCTTQLKSVVECQVMAADTSASRAFCMGENTIRWGPTVHNKTYISNFLFLTWIGIGFESAQLCKKCKSFASQMALCFSYSQWGYDCSHN